MLNVKRREFITLLGSAGLLCAAKARRARAEQSAMPVIGFLDPTSPEGLADFCRISPGPQGHRLCRRRERGDRIPLR